MNNSKEEIQNSKEEKLAEVNLDEMEVAKDETLVSPDGQTEEWKVDN